MGGTAIIGTAVMKGWGCWLWHHRTLNFVASERLSLGLAARSVTWLPLDWTKQHPSKSIQCWAFGMRRTVSFVMMSDWWLTWLTRLILAHSGPNSWARRCKLMVAASLMEYTESSSHLRHWGPSFSSKKSAPSWLANKGMYSMIARRTRQCLSSASSSIAGSRLEQEDQFPQPCSPGHHVASERARLSHFSPILSFIAVREARILQLLCKQQSKAAEFLPSVWYACWDCLSLRHVCESHVARRSASKGAWSCAVAKVATLCYECVQNLFSLLLSHKTWTVLPWSTTKCSLSELKLIVATDPG